MATRQKKRQAMPAEFWAPVQAVVNNLIETRYGTQLAAAEAIGIPTSQLSNFLDGLIGLGIVPLVQISKLTGLGLDVLLGRSEPGKTGFSSVELFEMVAREAGYPEESIRATRERYLADGGRNTNTARMLRFCEWHAADAIGGAPDAALAGAAPIAALPAKPQAKRKR